MGKPQFAIELWPIAEADLNSLRSYDHRRILEAIRMQLSDEPLRETRNRKPLREIEFGFEHRLPLWQLKVGEHRVFYDVEETARIVNVRAVRHKPRGKTAAEIVR